MRVLLSGGMKTNNIIVSIEKKFESSGDDLFVVEYIENIDKIFAMGNYFDKAIITEQSITHDGRDTDENTIRNKLNKFSKECARRRRDESFVFLTANEDLAAMIHEETLEIHSKSVIVLKPGPYKTKFFALLITVDIPNIPDEMRYQPPVEYGLYEEQTQNLSDISDDEIIPEDEGFTPMQITNFDNMFGMGEDDSRAARINDKLETSQGLGFDEEELGFNSDLGNEDGFNTETESDSNFGNFGGFGEDIFTGTKFGDGPVNDTVIDNDIIEEGFGTSGELPDFTDYGTGEEESLNTQEVEETQEDEEMNNKFDWQNNEDFGGTTEDNFGGFDSFGDENTSGFDSFGDEDASGFDSFSDNFGEENTSGLDNFGSEDTSGFDNFGSEDTSGFDNFGSEDTSGFDNFGSEDISGFNNFGSEDTSGFDNFGSEDTQMNGGFSELDPPSDNEQNWGYNQEQPVQYPQEETYMQEENYMQEEQYNPTQGQYPEPDNYGYSAADMFDYDEAPQNQFNNGRYDNPMTTATGAAMAAGMAAGYMNNTRNQWDNQPQAGYDNQWDSQPQMGYDNQWDNHNGNNDVTGGMFDEENYIDPNEDKTPIQQTGHVNEKISDKALKKKLEAFAARGNNICVTGCGGCGTSTVAFNLANTLANLGYSVLLVDFDTEGRSQSYISSECYKSMETDGANLMAAVNSGQGINTHTAVVKRGLHLLTMGIGGDTAKPEELLNESKISRFINLAKPSHNFVIYDVPFDSAVGFLSDAVYLSDNLVLVTEMSTHGIIKTMLKVCNIDSQDMQDTFFSKAQLVFNKYRNLNKLLGKKVKVAKDITKIMDDTVYDLIGEDNGLYFSSMHIAGLLADDPNYELAWFEKVQYSDTNKGKEIYKELIEKIVTHS